LAQAFLLYKSALCSKSLVSWEALAVTVPKSLTLLVKEATTLQDPMKERSVI